MNNNFEAKNTKLAGMVKTGAGFQIIHKNHTHFESEPDGYWVSEATPTDKVGYYSMVLVDLTVDDLLNSHTRKFGADLLVEEGVRNYEDMMAAWIPLPVLFEYLGLYHNFKDHDDLSTARAVDMIKSKTLAAAAVVYTNRKMVMAKKCGRLVAA